MYKKLYRDIMVKAQNENRIKGGEIYYESHHIIPDFMFKNRKRTGPSGHLDGNPDDRSNKVLLTFQEHILAHYYLYEILKTTRYCYSAGSALQFFFTKAVGGHARQRSITDVDREFLNEMAHLRNIGLDSISKARKGKMPVVDALTGESMGSVVVDHPKVVSGEWHHHSKGKPGTKHPIGWGKGKLNNNYKEMTNENALRVFNCIKNSVGEEGYFSVSKFGRELKKEFVEYKKISTKWIQNNFGTFAELIATYNLKTNSTVKYASYFRSAETRSKINKRATNWVTDEKQTCKIHANELENFLKDNPEYRKGRHFD